MKTLIRVQRTHKISDNDFFSLLLTSWWKFLPNVAIYTFTPTFCKWLTAKINAVWFWMDAPVVCAWPQNYSLNEKWACIEHLNNVRPKLAFLCFLLLREKGQEVVSRRNLNRKRNISTAKNKNLDTNHNSQCPGALITTRLQKHL